MKDSEVLYQDAKEILKLRSVGATAKRIIDFYKKNIGVTAGYVGLLSGNGNENRIVFLDSGSKTRKFEPYLSMPVEGIGKEAYCLKEPVFHNDFMNSRWMKFLPNPHIPLKNVMVIPLVLKGKVIGMIGIANKPYDFSQGDKDISNLFSDLAATALHNSRLFEEVRKQSTGKEKLISIIAHDVRNHLNSIQGFSNILMENSQVDDASQVSKFAGIIYSSTKNANQLLDDLLSWANSRNNKLAFIPGKFEITGLITSQLRQFSNISAEKGIQVIFDFNQPIYVFAHKNMVATIIRNLVSNALKFTNRGGSIVISIIPVNNDIEISVTDTGIGMTSHQVENILKPVQFVTAGTRKEKGTGLGLLLCKEFIEKHERKIKITSEPGKGSTFSFSLPQAKQ